MQFVGFRSGWLNPRGVSAGHADFPRQHCDGPSLGAILTLVTRNRSVASFDLDRRMSNMMMMA